MGLWKKQRNILTAFGVFLAFMFLCTLISRAVYASKLPQVTVEKPRRMALSHAVDADGIVVRGREYAVIGMTGLRVRTVYTRVGERVTPETLIFDVDMDDLQKKIQEQELALKKIKLQIAEAETKAQRESARAEEDYTRTGSETGDALRDAQEALEDAEDELDRYRDAATVTPEDERKAAQAAYEEWVKKEEELRAAMEKAKQEYEASPSDEDKKTAWETTKAEYETHMSNAVKKPDYSAEDEAAAEWREKKDALKAAVSAAEDRVEAAEKSRSDSLLEAERRVEDADRSRTVDSSLEILRLEMNVLQAQLSEYKKVLESRGQVYPKTDGIITRIQISPGERIPDGAAVVCADLSSAMQFNVPLTKEQKKYVNQGDKAQLTLGGSDKEEVTVDYVAENELNPELYDVNIFLPEGLGTIGQSGTFHVETRTETYNCCIPINALYEDANHRSFVYVVREQSGILGKELTAEQIFVKVLDKNESYAAIEEGVIDSETEVILSSTEAIEDRTVIRYRE